MYQVIAKYVAQVGRATEVGEKLSELARASRTEPANLAYEVARDIHEPQVYFIIESYSDAAGFAAHRQSEHFRKIGVAQILPLLADRQVSAFTGDGSLS